MIKLNATQADVTGNGMFRLTQLFQTLINAGNNLADERLPQIDNTSPKELTTIRLRPETKTYLQAQSEVMGISLSQMISAILDSVTSMEMKSPVDNKLKMIYDRIISLFELHKINPVDMAKMLSQYGLKSSQIRDPDVFIDKLTTDIIKDIAGWFSVDYKWIIGETERVYLSENNKFWYKNAYGFCVGLIQKYFQYRDFKIFVVKRAGVSFEHAEKYEDQGSRLDIGFILSYENEVNGVTFTKFEVCEFQRWNYAKCRGYLKFVLYFLNKVENKINSCGVSCSDTVIDGLTSGALLPATIKGMMNNTWNIEQYVGDITQNHDIESNLVNYLENFNKIISLLGHELTITGISIATKDFSTGWNIQYIWDGKCHEEFCRYLGEGFDDIYKKTLLK